MITSDPTRNAGKSTRHTKVWYFIQIFSKQPLRSDFWSSWVRSTASYSVLLNNVFLSRVFSVPLWIKVIFIVSTTQLNYTSEEPSLPIVNPSFSIAIHCPLILNLAKKINNLSLLHSLFMHIHHISPGSWHLLYDLDCSFLILSWFCYTLLSLFVMGSVGFCCCAQLPLWGACFGRDVWSQRVAAPAWAPRLEDHCTGCGSSSRWVWRLLWGERGPEGMHRCSREGRKGNRWSGQSCLYLGQS